MAKLDHIGIAVADLPAMKKLFALLGMNASGVEDVPEQGVRTHFIRALSEDAQIELLEPIDSNGSVSKFIEKKGPGIHHLSFRLSPGELDPLSALLRAEGYRLIYENPKKGAHGMKINFIHPASAGGVLVEIMEPG